MIFRLGDEKMAVGKLSNCSKCGQLFLSIGINTCPQCIKKVEDEYTVCAEYLKENRLVNIYVLSEETGISVNQITQFVREGRISVADTPNLGYPCQTCGTLINKGKLCDKCANSFNREINKVINNSKEEKVVKKDTYYQFKDRFDK